MALQYVARKRLKVAGRTVQPGEVVPEAATWRNVQAYVNNGSLAVALEVPEGAVEHAELTAQVAEMSERVAALERLVAGAGDQDGDAEVIDGEADDTDTEPEGGEAVDGTPDSETADQAAVEPIDVDALKHISRDELDAKAVALGIEDAPKLGSKGAVAAAINAALNAGKDGGDQ